MDNDNTCKIALFKNSGFAIVDSDFGFLDRYRWLLTKGRNTNYAKAYLDGAYEFMHHAVLGGIPPNGFVVDHVNGDGLDNRRENLRVVTNGDNIAFATKDAKGVYKLSRLKRKPWIAQVRIDGEKYHVGYFETQEEAIAARTAFLISRGKEVRTLDNR